MAFDAGSIIGSLDIDRTAFTLGLDEAKRQADEFAARTPTITPQIDTRPASAELDALRATLDEFARRTPTITPQIDTRVAAAEIRALELRLDEMARTRTIDIRTNSTGGGGGPAGAGGAASDAASGFSLLNAQVLKFGAIFPAVISLLPAVVPLLGAATGGALALAGGMAMGALAVGSFAAVAKSDLTDVSTALKAVGGDATKLPAQLRPLGTAVEQLKFSLAALKAETMGSVTGALTTGIHVLTTGMSEVAPLINATGRGLQMMFSIFQNFVAGPTFKSFINLTKNEVGPALTGIGVILVNVGNGMIRLFEVFNPLLVKLGQEAVSLSGKFNSFTQGNGFSKFVQDVYHDIVMVEPLLRQLGELFVTVFHALAPSGGQAVSTLTVIIGAINQMAPALQNIVALTQPFGKLLAVILPAVAPIINEIGQMAGQLIPILDALVQLFGQGLTAAMELVMPLLRDLDNAIIKPLVPVILQLIHAFEPLITTVFQALQPLIPPLNELFVALGKDLVVIAKALIPLVPVFITLTKDALIPIIPALTFLIKLLADVLNWIKPLLPVLAALGVAFALAFSDVGAIILIIGGLVMGVKAIIEHWSGIAHFFEGLWNDVYGFFKQYGAYILAFLVPFIGIPLVIAQHWGQIVGWLKKVWDDVWRDIKGAWGAIENFFSSLGSRIASYFTTAWNWLLKAGRDIITGLWNGIKEVWSTVINFYSTVYTTIFNFFVGAAKWLYKAGLDILTGLWNGIKEVWNTIYHFYAEVYTTILHFFLSAVSWLLHAGMDILTGLWNGIKTVWNTVYAFFAGIFGAITRFFGNAISWLLHAGGDILSGLWNGIKSVWNTVTSFFGGIFGAITGFFSGAISWLENIGEELIQGLWNGIQRIWHDLTGWLGDAAKGIGGIFKSVLSIFSPSRVMADIGMNTMLGLHIGLRDTFEGTVRPYLNLAAQAVADAFGGQVSGGFGANATITTAATVAIAGHAQAQATLIDRVNALTQAVKDLPGQTGDAVGNAVGNIEQATAKQTRDLVTAARTG